MMESGKQGGKCVGKQMHNLAQGEEGRGGGTLRRRIERRREPDRRSTKQQELKHSFFSPPLPPVIGWQEHFPVPVIN